MQKKAPKNTSRGLAAEFVRSLPRETPASEVVAKATARGIKLSTQTVYSVRSQDSKAARKRSAPSSSSSPPPQALETELYQCVAQLGLKRSRELFEQVERKFAHQPSIA